VKLPKKIDKLLRDCEPQSSSKASRLKEKVIGESEGGGGGVLKKGNCCVGETEKKPRA